MYDACSFIVYFRENIILFKKSQSTYLLNLKIMSLKNFVLARKVAA